LIHLNSHASGQTNDLDDGQFNWLLLEFHHTEQRMAVITIDRRQLDVAEGHCERSLAFARRFVLDGDQKTNAIFEALESTCLLRENQIDYPGALAFAEECYNVVVEAYNCVHPQVLKAAGVLIDILIKMDNLFDAERCAQVTYSNLRDKKNGIDQEGSEVANGACNLADVIFHQEGDLKKAEELAREALRIKTISYSSENHAASKSCDLSAQILSAQNDFGDKTRVLFQRCLAIFVRNEGPNEFNTALANLRIGRFYYQLSRIQTAVDSFRAQLPLAQSHFEESLRIYLKIHGPSYPPAVSTSEQLAEVLRHLCNNPE
jgi:tetratricopeptide (TPR) repeat protein